MATAHVGAEDREESGREQIETLLASYITYRSLSCVARKSRTPGIDTHAPAVADGVAATAKVPDVFDHSTAPDGVIWAVWPAAGLGLVGVASVPGLTKLCAVYEPLEP